MDILSEPGISMTIGEITDSIDEYLSKFSNPRMFDESTVRKKLKKYVSLGILTSKKKGKTVYYQRAESVDLPDKSMLDYFSEVLPCGVIGSYLLDKTESSESNFAFKHHYITGTMDSEILYLIFNAIREKKSVTLETVNKKKMLITEDNVIPIKVMISAQSGRQYLMAYAPRIKRIKSFRTDNIVSIKLKDKCERFDELQEQLKKMQPHIWGVSTQGSPGSRMEHVEFTIHYADDDYAGKPWKAF